MRNFYCEQANFDNDARNCAPDEAPVLILEDGTEKQLPTTWAVCDVCNGAGTHVNPAIDCDGLTSEDFDNDPDFAEDYISGAYDQTCNKCKGRTTVRAVNWDAMSEADQKAYQEQGAEEASYRAMCAAERRMGA